MNFRGLFLSGLVLLTTSFDLQAKLYSSPVLTEAYNLLINQPERTLTITQNYLEQRRLARLKILLAYILMAKLIIQLAHHLIP